MCIRSPKNDVEPKKACNNFENKDKYHNGVVDIDAIKGVLKEQTQEILSELQKIITAQQSEKEQRISELNTKLENKEEENLKLKEEKSELKKEIKEKTQIISNLEQDLEKSKLQVEQERSEKERALKQAEEYRGYKIYKDRYAAIDAVYSSYNELPAELKINLKNIFGSGDVCDVIIGASKLELDNIITQLWQFAQQRIIYKKNDAASAVKLFGAVFNFRTTACQGRYEMIRSNIGEKYDSDRHSIVNSNNKTDGVIAEVLLNGIYDLQRKEIIKKTLVKVN